MNPTTFDTVHIFNGKPSDTMISGYDTASEYTPAVDPSYLFLSISKRLSMSIGLYISFKKCIPQYL